MEDVELAAGTGQRFGGALSRVTFSRTVCSEIALVNRKNIGPRTICTPKNCAKVAFMRSVIGLPAVICSRTGR